MPIHMVVKQNTGSAEVRAVGLAAMLLDIPVKNAALEGLAALESELRGGALPVGSVEFVRAAMALAGVSEPENMSYPRSMRHLLGREVRLCPAGEARGRRAFVKPSRTKTFTGFVFDPLAPAGAREDEESFMALPDDEPVWVCAPVDFVAEWRAYALGSDLAGLARYDPEGAEGVAAPDKEWLGSALAALRSDPEAPAACAIDVGRLSDGSLALVEVNDAWALGLYGKAMEPKAYLNFLSARWIQMREAPAPARTPPPRHGP